MATPNEMTIDIPATVLAEAHSMHYVEWGYAGGRMVFCVHGLTRNGRDFDVLASKLADAGYHVICPDIAGRGKSPSLMNPASYNNLVYAADCLFLLAALEIVRVDWIGTSMGGIIGLLVANQAPALLHSLLLNDIGCLVEASALRRIATYFSQPNFFVRKEEALTALQARTLPFGVPAVYWDAFASHSIAPCEGGFRLSYDSAIGIVPLKEWEGDVNLWPLWEAAKVVPTILIRGEYSDILSKITAVQMQRTHTGMLFHEVPGAGHAPALMADEQVKMVMDWLGEVK